MKRLATILSSPNTLALAGVCCAGYGAYIVHPALMFVGVGSLLLFLGIVGVWKKQKESKP